MEQDVVIAGGGLNGTALALALAQAGLRVTVVEPQGDADLSADRFDGRAYALSISSQRLLAAIGLWAGIRDKAEAILGIKVSDGRAGDGPSLLTLDFDHAEIEEGPMGYMVEDRHLRRALLAAVAAEPRIARHHGKVAAQEPGTAVVTVTLDSGDLMRAALLVGCDGRGSPCAQRAGIGRMSWDYGQTAIVCAVAHERPHEGIAHQFFMPGGPLAILPLPGNRSSIVWSERRREAEACLAMDDAAFLRALRPRFGDYLGDIALDGDRFGYPLSLSLAHRYVGPRLALAGDAAHAVHPVAGQGLNAGLKDVGALAEVVVSAHRRGEDIGRDDVLSRYQSWRRFDVATLALSTDAVVRLFSNDNPLMRLGRDLGLGLVNRVAPLRRGLIREAAGLTGDLPRLNRGLAL